MRQLHDLGVDAVEVSPRCCRTVRASRPAIIESEQLVGILLRPRS